jgi:hypothetical protein
MGVARFGPGIAIVTRTDVSPSTPINIGYAQSLSLSWKGSTKDLFGQDQFPILSARSTIKTSGKLVAAVDSGIALNTMFFGQSFTAGGIIWSIGELHSVPASSTYTITVSNSATFDVDLGVVYTATSLPFQKVASVSAAGQYSEAAGVYTFDSADASAAVAITYSSTVTTPGQNIIIANKLPAAKPVIYRIYSCISDSLSDDFKLEDFALPTFDFSFFQNAAGQIAGKFYNEVS